MKAPRFLIIAIAALSICCVKTDKPNQKPSATPAASRSAETAPTPKAGGFDAALGAYRDKDLDKAETGFKEVVASEPKNADAHFYLGKIRVDRKDDEGSVAHFREAAKLDPKSVEKLMALGDAYFATKRFDTAIVEYGKIPGFEPNNADAVFKMGRTYVALGNKIAAGQQLRKLETLDKSLAEKLKAEIGK